MAGILFTDDTELSNCSHLSVSPSSMWHSSKMVNTYHDIDSSYRLEEEVRMNEEQA